MSVLITLKSLYGELTDAEKKVAEYFIKYNKRIPYESVSEIAENASVSVPSVTRLTQKLGFKNFKDFKVEFALSEAQPSAVTEVFSQIESEDGDLKIIDKVFLGYIKSLEDTLKILDKKNLVRFSKQCAQTSRLLFIGQGSSGIVGEEASLRFAHLDIQSESYTDVASILLQTLRIKKNQICVAVSHSGRTSIIGEGLKTSKEKGAVTALITNYMNTPFKKYCDYVFHTSFIENTVKSAAVSSKIAQTVILDALYLLTAKAKKNIWDFSELDSALERFLRST